MKNIPSSRHVISFLLALTVIFAGSTLYYGSHAEEYRSVLTHSHEKAYSELLESLSEIDSALLKIRFTASPATVSTLSAQIWREAEAAKSALSLLPAAEAGLEKTQTFIARTGDYAYSLLHSASRGQGIGSDQKEALGSLCSTAQNLTDEMTLLKARLDSGVLTYDLLPGMQGEAVLSNSFSTVEQEFPEYATLIYDGPFSEHLDRIRPVMLEGKQPVSEAQARTAAAAFCSLPIEELSLVYRGGDTIECYSFSGTGDVSIDVSVAGGIVYRMSNPRAVGAASLTPEQAVEYAADFLKTHGYSSMKESYYTRFEDVLTINFACVQDGITLYPDLVKVSVALDNGDIVGFESRGYLMSHCTRALDTPAVSRESAQQSVDSSLKIKSAGMALIPTDWKSELLCHEFVCETPDGVHVIVYINAMTGAEENLLLLIESEDGTLTL